MSSPEFSRDQWTERAVELCRIIERTLRESDAIDTESLCILSGSKVWAVQVNVTVLDHGGNLVDACAAAALASVLHFRRPSVSVEPSGNVTIYSWEERDPAPLAIHHTPVCVTFGFLEKGSSQVALVDPSFEEEQILSGFLSVAINAHGEICTLQKAGGCAVEADAMLRCLQLAHVRAQELIAAIREGVEASLQQRG